MNEPKAQRLLEQYEHSAEEKRKQREQEEYHLAPICDYLNTYARELHLCDVCEPNITSMRKIIDLIVQKARQTP